MEKLEQVKENDPTIELIVKEGLPIQHNHEVLIHPDTFKLLLTDFVDPCVILFPKLNTQRKSVCFVRSNTLPSINEILITPSKREQLGVKEGACVCIQRVYLKEAEYIRIKPISKQNGDVWKDVLQPFFRTTKIPLEKGNQFFNHVIKSGEIFEISNKGTFKVIDCKPNECYVGWDSIIQIGWKKFSLKSGCINATNLIIW